MTRNLAFAPEVERAMGERLKQKLVAGPTLGGSAVITAG